MKTLINIAAILLTAAALTFQDNSYAQGNQKTSNGTALPENHQPGYKTGIGLRAGFEEGITIKHFIKNDRALEGILSRDWYYGGIRLTDLFEIQKPFTGAKGLNWLYGAGGHIGFYNGAYYGYRY